jgi:hypothetical protein
MKRLLTAVAAVWTAIIPLRKEQGNPECKNPPCATEPFVAIPEPQHAPEEPTTYEVVGDEVWLMNTSPVVSFKLGSEEHLRWLRENGVSSR